MPKDKKNMKREKSFLEQVDDIRANAALSGLLGSKAQASENKKRKRSK